ncbi:MAG: alpha-E domain-containing protein [Spirosomataceae bacterium]
MLSRVADSVYWMNRYIERAENYARFIGVNFNLAFDLPPNVNEQWEPLLIATADHFLFYEHYDQPTRENVINFMTFDKRNPNSIYSCLLLARENGRTIRESISKEMWENLNELYLWVRNIEPKAEWDLNHMQAFYAHVRNGSQLFHGIVDSTITRNEAWHFGRLGRFMERADKTSRFLDVSYFTLKPESDITHSTLELVIWTAVLKSVSAYNMYRQQYQTLSPKHIVEFLILDKLFPRAMAHCIRQAELSLYEISGTPLTNRFSNQAEKMMGKLRSEIDFTDVEEIFGLGLHQYLDQFQIRGNEVSKSIFECYFDLKPVESYQFQSQSQG